MLCTATTNLRGWFQSLASSIQNETEQAKLINVPFTPWIGSQKTAGRKLWGQLRPWATTSQVFNRQI
jgi:hypothetical protein